MLVYLNGKFLPRDQATISVDDRGFLFGDSLYEVIRCYQSFLFEKEAHLQRLQNGLTALQLNLPEFDKLSEIAARLIRENHLGEADAMIYIQVTRGVWPVRHHAFPPQEISPTIYVAINPIPENPDRAEHGVAAITVPDLRWGRCDIKSTNLLANVLANQQARVQGADEAIFVNEGVAVEGSHSNLFAVRGSTIFTHPQDSRLLPGITRDVVIKICRELNIHVQEHPTQLTELLQADELFLTQTSGEVVPLVRLDGKPICDGKPGALTRRLQQAFHQYVTKRQSGMV